MLLDRLLHTSVLSRNFNVSHRMVYYIIITEPFAKRIQLLRSMTCSTYFAQKLISSICKIFRSLRDYFPSLLSKVANKFFRNVLGKLSIISPRDFICVKNATPDLLDAELYEIWVPL